MSKTPRPFRVLIVRDAGAAVVTGPLGFAAATQIAADLAAALPARVIADSRRCRGHWAAATSGGLFCYQRELPDGTTRKQSLAVVTVPPCLAQADAYWEQHRPRSCAGGRLETFEAIREPARRVSRRAYWLGVAALFLGALWNIFSPWIYPR